MGPHCRRRLDVTHEGCIEPASNTFREQVMGGCRGADLMEYGLEARALVDASTFYFTAVCVSGKTRFPI